MLGIIDLGMESGATLQELHQACDAVAKTLEAEVAARMAAKAGADVADAAARMIALKEAA